MPTIYLDGPVGLRWNKVNVDNSAEDQRRVIALLRRIKVSDGGKKEAWPAPILDGGDGKCAPILLDAIWTYQRHWQKRGIFKNIDGVVDPGGHTIYRLNLMAGGGGAEPGPPDLPSKLIIRNERVPGTWQVTNVWTASLGEVGLVGGAKVEITQPDGKKFVVSGAGAGVGIGIDPISYAKALTKGLQTLIPFFDAAKFGLTPILEMLAKGVGFSLGDYLQLFGMNLLSLTRGVLIANPLNKYIGRPLAVSRYAITEAGKANFGIASLSGGIGAGGECGLMGFGGPVVGPAVLLCPVLGSYGSIGVTAKVGAGGQYMIYATTGVTDT
jgi:hypothetical protein